MATQGEANNKGRKRRQRYLPHNKPVKKNGSYPLRPGVEGFFLTCDGGREHQASVEAINIFDSFFDELFHGKDETPQAGVALPRPLNKKIKFEYSDSSDSEGDGDKEDDSGEENEASKDKPPSAARADVSPEYQDERKKDIGSDEEDKEPPVKKRCSGRNESESGSHGQDKTEPKNDNVSEKKNCELPAKKQCSVSSGSNVGNGLDKPELSIDQQIEAELAELRDKNKRRFLKLDSGCNGVLFIQMRRKDEEPGPKEIVQLLMETAFSTKKHMSRFIQRVLPIEVACYSSEEEISRAVKPVINKYFPVETETAVKFAVLYDARANTGIDRMKIIDAVAKSVPPPHKVDLKTPDKTIVVQIVKTVCLIGVVEKYKELVKYNIRQLTSSSKP